MMVKMVITLFQSPASSNTFTVHSKRMVMYLPWQSAFGSCSQWCFAISAPSQATLKAFHLSKNRNRIWIYEAYRVNWTTDAT